MTFNVALAALAVAPALGSHAAVKSFYDFTMTNIDGKATHLKAFKGKVLLVVNVASLCGNTPQYAALEALQTKYGPKRFDVLGFPANEFGHQEPGDNGQIKEFCTSTYHVTFPMFSKIVVKGDGINPLYQWLLANGPSREDIHWNFEKFLISRDGRILARFDPKTKPDSPEVVKAIESALHS